jgi:transposase
VGELLVGVKEAPAAGITEAEAGGRALCVLALLDAIETCNARAKGLEAEVVERLEFHRDAHVFTSLPRAGRGVRAASLLWEIGDARQRFPDEESLAALAGVAPVTRASGKARSVGFRWACDKKLRNALVDFADESRHASPWAARVYAEAISPRQTAPSRRADPRSCMGEGDLAHVARRRAVRHHQARRCCDAPSRMSLT